MLSGDDGSFPTNSASRYGLKLGWGDSKQRTKQGYKVEAAERMRLKYSSFLSLSYPLTMFLHSLHFALTLPHHLSIASPFPYIIPPSALLSSPLPCWGLLLHCSTGETLSLAHKNTKSNMTTLVLFLNKPETCGCHTTVWGEAGTCQCPAPQYVASVGPLKEITLLITPVISSGSMLMFFRQQRKDKQWNQ